MGWAFGEEGSEGGVVGDGCLERKAVREGKGRVREG